MKRIFISSIATLMILASSAFAEFCPKCGTKTIDDANFCYKCGIKLPTAKKPVRKPVSTNGTFEIVVRPAGARVLIDGKDVGPGLHTVTPNVYHNVTVSHDGFTTYSRDTYAKRGRTRRLNVVLMKNEEWYAGPRIGASLFTGIIGVEFQRRHLAMGFGFGTLAGVYAWEDASFSLGIKYYGNPYRSSWYVGAGYQRAENSKGTGLYRSETTYQIIGMAMGYRWRWGRGWDLSAGFGPARWEEAVKDYEGANRPANTSRGEGMYFAPCGEIAFGYSF